MRHVNKAELLGRLFNDPEIKHLSSGNRLCTFKLVTDENRMDKATNDWVRTSEFHRIIVWNEDFIKEIEGGVRKGATVQVVGKIKTRKWQGQDGNDRYSTEIVVDRFGEFQFLEAAKNKSEDQQQTAHPTSTPRRAPASLEDDEVPF